jgi:Fic family protein
MKPFIPQNLPIRELAWEALIPLIGSANRALSHYDGILYGVPNSEILLSPLTTQEAVLSSRIEGTQATLGEVLKFEAGEEPESESRLHDIQEIMNYRAALRAAEEELKTRPFNLNLLLRLHDILLDSVRGENKARGRFRAAQNWIGSAGCKIEKAQFVPPEPALLPKALDNWEEYYHADQPDALVQLAVVHAQFEIIHPFLDGNGRLGRILIPLFLFEKKHLARPVFYLSAYLEGHRDEYIEKLRAIGHSADGWNDWIAFFLRALDEQARLNAAKARAIMDMYESLKQRTISLTRSQFAVPLLDQLFERPIFQINQLRFEEPRPSRQAVFGLLRALRQSGILKVVREGSGPRAQVFALAELVNLCEGKQAV